MNNRDSGNFTEPSWSQRVSREESTKNTIENSSSINLERPGFKADEAPAEARDS